MGVQQRKYMGPEEAPANVFDAMAAPAIEISPSKAELTKDKKELKEARARIAMLEKLVQDLHEKNLARPEVKPLADSLCIFLVVLCGLKIDTSDERDRQRLVGAQELCQRALLIAGSGSMFPACRIAGQLACQAYWDFCAHPSEKPEKARKTRATPKRKS